MTFKPSPKLLNTVYFVQETHIDGDTTNPYYKVGYTEGSMKTRLVNLQVGNPRLLKPVKTIKTTSPQKLESYLKEKLKHGYHHKQYRLSGEWYYIDPSWLNTILFELEMRDARMKPELGIVIE